MSLDETPLLGLDRLLEGQAEPENSINSAMNFLDMLVHLTVISRVLANPPGDAANGAVYLIPSGATGVWSTKVGQIAGWYDGWKYVVVNEGFRMWVANEDVYLIYDGSVWKSIMTETVHESFAKPEAAKAVTLLAAVNANGNSVVDTQINYPANVVCTLAGGSAAVDIIVTITGTLANGMADTEDIAVGPANGDFVGDKAFAHISDIAYTDQPAGDWDGGNIVFYNGTKIGLLHKNAASVYKIMMDGAHDGGASVFDAVNNTIIPSIALNGAKALEIWYKTEQFV